MLASLQSRAGRERSPLRRRLFAILLAFIIEALLVLVLLTLNAWQTKPKPEERAPTTFQMVPTAENGGGEQAAKPAPAARAKPKPEKAEVDPTIVPPIVPPPPQSVPVPEPVPKKDPFPDLVRVDKDTLSSADIGKIPSTARDGSGGSGKDSVAANGPGEGPGGQPLYNAEWVREPTQAELAFYLPPIKQSGWALIACKTAPDNRVENCRTMGESPRGSGLSRGFREAAWQFRVYPPRVGGKKLIGAWVRIYYELTVTTTQK